MLSNVNCSSKEEHGYYLPTRSPEKFIGEATFMLPEPKDKTPLILTISGSYSAIFTEGTRTPGIKRATASYTIPVMEEK